MLTVDECYSEIKLRLREVRCSLILRGQSTMVCEEIEAAANDMRIAAKSDLARERLLRITAEQLLAERESACPVNR